MRSVYVYFSVNVNGEETTTADSLCAFVTHGKTSAWAVVACMRVLHETIGPKTFNILQSLLTVLEQRSL